MHKTIYNCSRNVRRDFSWCTWLIIEASFDPEVKTCMSFTDKGGVVDVDPSTVVTLTCKQKL